MEMIPVDPIAGRLAQLPTRLDVWRAALLGTLTGAAIVIAWIELSSPSLPVAVGNLRFWAICLAVVAVALAPGLLVLLRAVSSRAKPVQRAAEQSREKQITIAAWRG
jgi:hypothetical protein